MNVQQWNNPFSLLNEQLTGNDIIIINYGKMKSSVLWKSLILQKCDKN